MECSNEGSRCTGKPFHLPFPQTFQWNILGDCLHPRPCSWLHVSQNHAKNIRSVYHTQSQGHDQASGAWSRHQPGSKNSSRRHGLRYHQNWQFGSEQGEICEEAAEDYWTRRKHAEGELVVYMVAPNWYNHSNRRLNFLQIPMSSSKGIQLAWWVLTNLSRKYVE